MTQTHHPGEAGGKPAVRDAGARSLEIRAITPAGVAGPWPSESLRSAPDRSESRRSPACRRAAAAPVTYGPTAGGWRRSSRRGRHRGRGQARAGQGRVQQNETCGLARFPRRAEFTPVGPEAGSEFSAITWRIGDTECFRHPRGVGDVAVAPRRVERIDAVSLVSEQETVDLGHMHPAEKVGISGAVGLSARSRPTHPVVYGTHTVDRVLCVVRSSVCGDGEKGTGALEPPPGVAAIAGMSFHGGHGQRVQGLEQERPQSADEHGRIAVDRANRPVRTEPARAGCSMDTGAVPRPCGPGDLGKDRAAQPLPQAEGGTRGRVHTASMRSQPQPQPQPRPAGRCARRCATAAEFDARRNAERGTSATPRALARSQG